MDERGIVAAATRWQRWRWRRDGVEAKGDTAAAAVDERGVVAAAMRR